MPIITEYVGSGLSRSELTLAEVSIHPTHREDEATLIRQRWFDYRQVRSAEATYLFAAHYRHEYLKAYERTQDLRTVDRVSPFSPEDIFASTEKTAMWLARREADSIGCKYDFYLHLAFERFATRGWKNLPRPNQLYSEELTLDIADAWKKRCREIQQFAEDPFYTNSHYVAHPDQDAYHTWVVEQIRSREHKHMALACAFKKNSLPEELAGKEFGTDLVRLAKQLCW